MTPYETFKACLQELCYFCKQSPAYPAGAFYLHDIRLCQAYLLRRKFPDLSDQVNAEFNSKQPGTDLVDPESVLITKRDLREAYIAGDLNGRADEIEKAQANIERLESDNKVANAMLDTLGAKYHALKQSRGRLAVALRSRSQQVKIALECTVIQFEKIHKQQVQIEGLARDKAHESARAHDLLMQLKPAKIAQNSETQADGDACNATFQAWFDFSESMGHTPSTRGDVWYGYSHGWIDRGSYKE